MKTTLRVLLLVFAQLALGADAPTYEGYERDRVLIRSTYRLSAPVVNASSGEAIQAAHRIFKNIRFVGRSRAQVLAILGDPKTISGYGVAADAAADSPLTYRFDSGFGGWEYVIRFAKGVVTQVDQKGLD
ncbi:hypothetical protein [Prosthecobacter sp.]|uniref:hypothetical protein n=1 Tax=Prosthecobacter sp. TaxID=1965333 RepID=UPI00248A1A58|nr:hypothetical protein [Prosthecobacter sp.]MDI1312703.1 hypothetical protein [Prosthecobacter sp.]